MCLKPVPWLRYEQTGHGKVCCTGLRTLDINAALVQTAAVRKKAIIWVANGENLAYVCNLHWSETGHTFTYCCRLYRGDVTVTSAQTSTWYVLLPKPCVYSNFDKLNTEILTGTWIFKWCCRCGHGNVLFSVHTHKNWNGLTGFAWPTWHAHDDFLGLCDIHCALMDTMNWCDPYFKFQIQPAALPSIAVDEVQPGPATQAVVSDVEVSWQQEVESAWELYKHLAAPALWRMDFLGLRVVHCVLMDRINWCDPHFKFQIQPAVLPSIAVDKAQRGPPVQTIVSNIEISLQQEV